MMSVELKTLPQPGIGSTSVPASCGRAHWWQEEVIVMCKMHIRIG